ncbi:MAG: sugar ABC transporter ATP-binding protein [Rhodopila sp.]
MRDQPDTDAPFLCLSGVHKRYGGVTALDGVDFACRRGSIHAVLGENGAGKSTLIKIIAGAVQPDSGRMEVDGQSVHFADPLDAVRHGFVCVFQELSLLPDLSVADNICITGLPGMGGFINSRAQRRRAELLLARVGCPDIDPRTAVHDLPLSRRQLVEFAKALGRSPRLLIMDEATSALTATDVQTVYMLLRALRDEGTAILFISHRMHEIDALADTCSVFRSGRHIETFAQGSRSEHDIINLMIGREIAQTYPPKPPPVAGKAAPVLQVRDLAWNNRLQGISLDVRRGEILGLGGLDGQGQRELLLALFGVLKDVTGSIVVNGMPVAFGGPKAAMSGETPVALVPEDRKIEGLLLPLSVRDNLSLASLDRLRRGPVLDRGAERRLVTQEIERLRIKAGSVSAPVGTLSGGNQQKVVLGKWLATNPGILLLMDPTRGIDVGTKQEFYALVRQLADSGVAVLFYSTDYDELIGMCDRVAIIYRGHLVRELAGADITEANIVTASLSIRPVPGDTPRPTVGA